ncbi:MAG: pantetheine-phosphate adenylyltransferase [Deltaproteobacteria bacterium]|nr:pantetheine-phosphate adenylyltransferase [Deltaproteobacteria bacterium]
MQERIAVYAGSFDPITNGHISLIRRALEIFDKVIVAIAINREKRPLFTVEERLEMIREGIKEKIKDYERVEVDAFEGLLVDYTARRNAKVILRGLRAVSDFDYELQLALMNRRLNRDIQSVFLMTDFKWLFLSSTIVKEAARFGGDIRGLVPQIVVEKLREKFKRP